MSILRRPCFALLLLAAAAPLEAQRRTRDRDDDRDGGIIARVDTTVPLGARGVVDLSLVSGEIVVTSRGDDRVRVVATLEDDGELRFEAAAGKVALTAKSVRNRLGDAYFEVEVPRGTRVLMNTVSGDQSVSEVRGEVSANSVSGDLAVIDASGPVAVHTVSGDLRAERIAGNLRITSVSGDLVVRDVTGDIEVRSVSGEIYLRGARSRSVRAETVSGEIQYDGTIDPAGRYSLHTHSGEVSVVVSGDASARVVVETFSGEIESDFPMVLEPGAELGHGRQRRLDFRIGDGGAMLDLKTFSGDIQIVRGTDRERRDDR